MNKDIELFEGLYSHTKKLIFVDDVFLHSIQREKPDKTELFIEPNIDTQVIKIPPDRTSKLELIEKLEGKVDVSLITAGSILIAPFYGQQFRRIDYFAKDIVVDKYQNFAQLCLLLGAKKIAVKRVEVEHLNSESESSHDVGASVSIGVKAELSGQLNKNKNSLKEDIEKHLISLNYEADGSDPNLEQAERFINRYNLFDDNAYTNIFENRSIDNKVKSFKFILDTSNESEILLNKTLSATVAAMAFIYKANADFCHMEKSLQRSMLSTKVEISVEF